MGFVILDHLYLQKTKVTILTTSNLRNYGYCGYERSSEKNAIFGPSDEKNCHCNHNYQSVMGVMQIVRRKNNHGGKTQIPSFVVQSQKR